MPLGPRLDPATLLFSISLMGFLMAAVSLSCARMMQGSRAALVEWSWAMTCLGGGFLLFYLRGAAPWFLTFLVSNALVMAMACGGLLAHARLFGRPRPARLAGVLWALGMSGAVWVHLEHAAANLAVFTLSAALAVTLVVTAMLVSRYAAPRGTPASLIAATTLLVTAIAFGLRAFVSLTGEASQVSLASQSAPQVAILLIGALFVAGSTLGFIAMAQDRQRQQALELARRDGLTGLYTRTAFLEKVEAVSQSARPRRYAVVMADIDHFKGINDTFGHAGGDAVLAHAARMLVGAARSSDVVGRYGGEEFCIVLWDCDAVQVAEYELRIVMEAQRQSVRLPGGRTANYTLSVGHACWSDAGADAAQAFPDVIERADQALCLAKRSGRNQAVAASRVALALVEP